MIDTNQIDREYNLLQALEAMHKTDGLSEMIDLVNDYLNAKTIATWKMEPIITPSYSKIDVSMSSIQAGE